MRDALGNETEYSYDVCDRLIEIRQNGDEIQENNTKLNEEIQKARELNNKGRASHITKYERDLMGNVILIRDAMGNTERYAYNKRDELIEKVDKEGYLTKYGYTAHGDIKRISYADGREVKLT